MVERTVAYCLTMLGGALPAGLLFLLLRPWRLHRLNRLGWDSPRRRERVLAVFWMYCGGVGAITLTPRWLVWSVLDAVRTGRFSPGGPFFSVGSVSLIPFRTFRWSAYSLYNLLGNVIVFLPFGFFAAMLWRGFTWGRALLLGLSITGLIECCQLFIGRAFDVDDLLLNALGVVCGYWIWRFMPVPAGRYSIVPVFQ